MDDEKEGQNSGISVGERKSDKSCAQHRGPKEIDGRWIRRRLMAWLREVGLKFADIIVKSDEELAQESTWGSEHCQLLGMWKTPGHHARNCKVRLVKMTGLGTRNSGLCVLSVVKRTHRTLTCVQ